MGKTKARLPEDLIAMEILPRVNSVNSLLRFKSVSKTWNSILSSNPNFAKLHLQFQKQNNEDYTLLYYYDGYSVLFSLKSVNFTRPQTIQVIEQSWNHNQYLDFQNYYLIGSYNGLICFYEKPKNNYAIWNPLTRALRIIRGHSDAQRWKNNCIMRQGFGYSTTCDTYKIVVVSLLIDRCCAYIFSTRESTRWRRVDIDASRVDLFNRRYKPTDPSVQVGETLHWSLISTISNKNPVILTFDLACDSVHSVPLPGNGLANTQSCFVSNIGGRLCVAWRNSGGDLGVEVWTLERESWRLFVNHTGLNNEDYELQGLLEVKHDSTRRVFAQLYDRNVFEHVAVQLSQPVGGLVKPPPSYLIFSGVFASVSYRPKRFWTVQFIESVVSPFTHERRSSKRLAGIKRKITN